MKINTIDLVKFKKLKRRLGDSVRGTIGVLELLWRATAQQSPQGDIGRFSNEDIAALCDWDGDPDVLVQSLVETGWLDHSEMFRLIVHDWKEHAPAYVCGNLKRTRKLFCEDIERDARTDADTPDRWVSTSLAQGQYGTDPEASTILTQGSGASNALVSTILPSQVKSSLSKPSEVKPDEDTPALRVKSQLEIPHTWNEMPKLMSAIDRWISWILRIQKGDVGKAAMQIQVHLEDIVEKLASGRTIADAIAAIKRSMGKDGKYLYWDELDTTRQREGPNRKSEQELLIERNKSKRKVL